MLRIILLNKLTYTSLILLSWLHRAYGYENSGMNKFLYSTETPPDNHGLMKL